MTTLDALKPYAKAIAAALVAALTTAAPLVMDGQMSASDWAWTLAALLGGGGLTYAVPNKPSKSMSQTEVDEQSIQDRGVS